MINDNPLNQNYSINLATELLFCAQNNQDTQTLRKNLYYVSLNRLQRDLANNELRIIFWLNIYAAFSIILESKTEGYQLDEKLKQIKIARTYISLHDIEHRILVHKKALQLMYYFTNTYYANFLKTLAVSKNETTTSLALQEIKNKKDYITAFNTVDLPNDLLGIKGKNIVSSLDENENLTKNQKLHSGKELVHEN